MSVTLNWTSDRGFELDLDASADDISVRLGPLPVPADGTGELRSGVELDRLEILFKALVDVSGAPGQLVEAQVQLVEEDAKLRFVAKVEDVETGEVLDFASEQPVALPPGVPQHGGPRPSATTEDELDWEDETTLEKMILNAPENAARLDDDDEEEPEEDDGKGLAALLQALMNVDDPQAVPHEPTEPEVDLAAALKAAAEAEASAEPADQQFSEAESAKMFLELLIRREGLEIEDEHSVDELVDGVVGILASRRNPEAQAEALAEWLLEQPAVADLYIADDDLAEILEQW